MTWERARHPEQIEVWRNAILYATRRQNDECQYEDISLNQIAREAGISKPSVYRYFSTREEIFLAIFDEELDRLAASMVRRLNHLSPPSSAEEVSRTWVDILMKFPDLMNLMPQLSQSLENNSSVENIVAIKKKMIMHAEAIVGALALAYPRLSPDQWLAVFESTMPLMTGLWASLKPGENVVAALKHPDIDMEPRDFRSHMERGMVMLILGAEAMDIQESPSRVVASVSEQREI